MPSIQGDFDIWTFHLYGSLLLGVVILFLHIIFLEIINLLWWETPRSKLRFNYFFFWGALAIGYLGTGIAMGVEIRFNVEPTNRVISYIAYSDGFSNALLISGVFSFAYLLRDFVKDKASYINPYIRTYITRKDEVDENEQDELEILKRTLQQEKDKSSDGEKPEPESAPTEDASNPNEKSDQANFNLSENQ